ncbi:GTP pyrophosphokinase [Mesorhizobium sp. M0520]|uniref:GTP pyrophosphokinase n=1 Tax=Mesorhizobium sp. M0520 TaxID=2956957 RepID=UPI003337B00A
MDLDQAIKIAVDAHEGQTDKAGLPYILHPLRVMLAQSDDTHRIVAVLHDVVEDSKTVGLGDILALFGEEIRAAVDSITRRPGEPYGAYCQRAAANPIGKAVKMADLADNLDPKRAAALTDSQIRKYVRARDSIASAA